MHGPRNSCVGKRPVGPAPEVPCVIVVFVLLLFVLLLVVLELEPVVAYDVQAPDRVCTAARTLGRFLLNYLVNFCSQHVHRRAMPVISTAYALVPRTKAA
jgi:hypothetical protein